MITNTLQELYRLLKKNHTIMAIDYGEKKVGIAISNPNHTIAMPIGIIRQHKEDGKIREILNIIQKHYVGGIILGLPVRMNGELDSGCIQVRKFAELLQSQSDLPIYFQDERLTSKEADNILKSFNIKRKVRNSIDDAISASLILETTLKMLVHNN